MAVQVLIVENAHHGVRRSGHAAEPVTTVKSSTASSSASTLCRVE